MVLIRLLCLTFVLCTVVAVSTFSNTLILSVVCRLGQAPDGKLSQLVQVCLSHPSQSRGTIAAQLIRRYAKLGAEFAKLTVQLGASHDRATGKQSLAEQIVCWTVLCALLQHIGLCTCVCNAGVSVFE